MKKLLSILAALISIFNLSANDKSKVDFVYDVDFETRFDNREFGNSGFSPSMTIFGACLTPSVGLSVKGNGEHRLMVGLDVMKDFGSGKRHDLFNEMTLHYNYSKKIGDVHLGINAGIFSRDLMGGTYSEAFFSDSLKFYDRNLEGLLLTFQRPEAYFEVGCDWMGQYSALIREKFMIFSAGEGRVLPFMNFGYAAYMLHFANSDRSKGLVDNLLLNPYALFDFGDKIDFQKFQLRLGWLQAMQRDRKYKGYFVFPYGIEFDQHLRNWNVGIHNKMFFGSDMMPYYNDVDNAGLKYGTDLYYGDPFYRIHDYKGEGMGFYDRLEVYYEPFFGKYLKLRVAALFHFHGMSFTGCAQVISLKFDLNGLLKNRNKN